MKQLQLESRLRDEPALRWSCLEDERDACVVVSDRMEVVYINTAARQLVPPREWFGKRCFEVLPIGDETCALHCQKMKAVNESLDVVYCEETLCLGNGAATVLGVALIPLGPGEDHARAVLMLRGKEDSGAGPFQAQLLADAKRLRRRIGLESPGLTVEGSSHGMASQSNYKPCDPARKASPAAYVSKNS